MVKQDPEWTIPQERWAWQAPLGLVNFSHNNGAKFYWWCCLSERARTWIWDIIAGHKCWSRLLRLKTEHWVHLYLALDTFKYLLLRAVSNKFQLLINLTVVIPGLSVSQELSKTALSSFGFFSCSFPFSRPAVSPGLAKLGKASHQITLHLMETASSLQWLRVSF